VHLRKSFKLTEETNSANISGFFIAIFSNAVRYVDRTDRRYIR